MISVLIGKGKDLYGPHINWVIQKRISFENLSTVRLVQFDQPTCCQVDGSIGGPRI